MVMIEITITIHLMRLVYLMFGRTRRDILFLFEFLVFVSPKRFGSHFHRSFNFKIFRIRWYLCYNFLLFYLLSFCLSLEVAVFMLAYRWLC